MFFWNPIQTRRISFSANRVLNLTPMGHLTVVPAPGPGKAIQVVSAAFKLNAGKHPFAFTNDMVLTAGHLSRPQFNLEAAIINSSFDEWVNMVPLERGSLQEDAALTFGPSAGANTSPIANGDIAFDITYRLVKA
jgi:hypothetical protein